MALIDFYIRNQKLSKTAPTLVADSINYVNCSFTFKTDDWNGFDKWVVFSKGQENYRVDLIDDAIPKEAGLNLGEGLWSVSVFGENPEGTERITTNSVTVEVAKSTVQSGEPLPPISLTEAEQISAKAQLALNTANEILAKAESGEFNGAPGKDGEPGKPGEPGKDGYTPVKGIDYFDGENATPEQIAEAVEDYFEENPVPGGGGGGSAEVTAESIKTALGYTPADEADIPTKPEDVGAEKAGAVAEHNVAADSHNDIRVALADLKAEVEAFLDIDEPTLDQLSELIAKIQANAGSIEQLTNGKVNVSDIVNNLTTNVANKPLSAAQGVVLKGLIDAIKVPTKTSQLTNDSGFITAEDIPESGGGAAIIDVPELPTEGKEDVFYRVPTVTPYLGMSEETEQQTIYVVDELPEIGEPITTDMVHLVFYYSIADNDVFGYVPSFISSQYGLPEGWYPASLVFQLIGFNYGGIIYSEKEILADSVVRFLLTYDICSFKNVWKKQDSVGWAGEGNGSEIHNYIGNIASGEYSFAEGAQTTASGVSSHAEGVQTNAEGNYSHAEGNYSHAEGNYSHAEGNYTNAGGDYSHAEGEGTTAGGDYSHAEGQRTFASSNHQHAQGKYNIIDAIERYAHIVGNGTSSKPSNAHTLDWSGNAWYAGDVFLGGTSQDDAPLKVKEAISEAKTNAQNASNKVDNLESRMNSGEFKGADGYTPVKGVDYFDGKNGKDGVDGKDYVLTSSDKAEIAEMVDGATIVQAPTYVDSVDKMTDTSRVYVLASTGRIWSYMDTTVEQEVTVTDELDDKTFIEGSRFGSSATSFTDGFSNDAAGYNITPLIDLTKDKYQGKVITIHLEGSQYVTAANTTWIMHRAYGYNGSVRYARAATYPNASDAIALWKGATFNIISDTNATITITPPLKYGSNNYDIGYLRFCGKGAGSSSHVYITYKAMQTVTGGQWTDTGTTYAPTLTNEDKEQIANDITAMIDTQLLSIIGDGVVG